MEYTIEKIQEEEAIFAGFSVKKTWKEMAEMFPGPVKAEKIEVTEEEYEKELERLSESYQMEIDKLKEMIAGNDKAVEQIKEDLAMQKAIDFVVSNAKEA